MFEPVARVPQLVARLLAAEYRLELRATDRLLASPVGPTKSSQKAPNTQPRALSTGSAVFVLRVLPTKSRPEQMLVSIVVSVRFLRFFENEYSIVLSSIL